MASEYDIVSGDLAGDIDWSSFSSAYQQDRKLSFGEKILTGAALSGVSAIYGLANTVPLIANAVGGKGTMEYLSTLDAAKSLDDAFDSGDMISDFYSAHREGIELAGAIVGSLAPGGLAVKGTNTALKGISRYSATRAAANSGDIVGKAAALYTGLENTVSKTAILRNSYNGLLRGQNNLSSLITMDRFLFGAASAGKLAIDSAVYEIATVATQLKNPTFSDINDLGDFGNHIKNAAIFGGAFGGALGHLFYKTEKFLPSIEALEETTLRDTARSFNSARQFLFDVNDFGAKINNLPSGDRIASIAADRVMDEEFLSNFVDHFFKNVPSDKKEEARKLAQSWVLAKERSSEGLLNDFLQKLAPDRNSNIIADVQAALLNKTPEGTYPLDGERLAKVFGGMTHLDKVTVSINSRGIGFIRPVAELTEDQMARYQSALWDSSFGQKMREHNSLIRAYKDLFASQGFSRFPKLKDAEAAGISKEIWQDYKALRANEDWKGFSRLLEDPSELDAFVGSHLGLTADDVERIKSFVSLDDVASQQHFYDLVERAHTTNPIFQLGDLFPKSGTDLIVKDNIVKAGPGGPTILRNAKESFNSSTFPENIIEAQTRWEIAPQILKGSKKNGINVAYKDGKVNPFALARAIDSGMPIVLNGENLSREKALKILTQEKKKLRDFAQRFMGMDNETARLYADLPEGEIPSLLTRGRENNFLTRRNIVATYEQLNTIPEMDLKSLEAIRDLIHSKQLQAQQHSLRIAQNMGISIPEEVMEIYNELLNKGINSIAPEDFTARIGPGAITNATGKMFSMNMLVTALGTTHRNWIETGKRDILSRLASSKQKVLKGTRSQEDLDYLSMVHKKVTGSGTKYYHTETVMKYFLPNAPAEIGLGEYISQQVVDVISAAARNAQKGSAPFQITDDLQRAIAAVIESNPSLHQFSIENQNVRELLNAYRSQEVKNRRNQLDIWGARGMNIKNYVPGQLYFPALDVGNSPFFVMVRDRTLAAMDGNAEYSFIHARSEAELTEKINRITQQFPELDIFTKKQISDRKIALGEFEWGKSFYAYNIDSKLHSKGIFSELDPRNGREILEEMEQHLTGGFQHNVRSLVKNLSGDFLDNNSYLSETVNAFAKSTHGKAFGRGTKLDTGDNFYRQLNNTLLDIGPNESSEGVLGSVLGAQNALVEYMDRVAAGALDTVKEFQKILNPKKEELLHSRMENLLNEGKKLGINYEEMTAPMLERVLDQMDTRSNRQYLTRKVQQTLNAVSAGLTLSLDMVYPFVLSISMPVLINSSIREMLREASPEVKHAINSLGITGHAARVGSKSIVDFWKNIPNIGAFEKVRAGQPIKDSRRQAMNQWLQTDNGRFYQEMADLGFMPPSMRQMMIEIDATSDFSQEGLARGFREKFKKAYSFMAFPARYAEAMQRYVALDVAKAISEVAGLQGVQRYNMLHSYATMANGVFTAAQRPGLFQGAIGGSFGLYKSFAINMMQALGRHIEGRDFKSALTLAAMYGTTFGLRSIPGMPLVNSYIARQNEEDGRDLYSTVQLITGGPGKLSNSILYGIGSTFTGIGLFTRGDLNYLPFGNPLDEKTYPAVNQMSIALGQILGALGQIMTGYDPGTAILNAIAHQSAYRPAARVSEFALGQQTTRNGNFISPIDNDSYWTWNFLVRMAGARPANEAILSDAYYRANKHRWKKSEAMSKLRIPVRQAISQGDEINWNDVADRYIRAGGNPRDFRSWVQDQYRSTREDDVSKLRDQLRKSGRTKLLQQLDQPYIE